MIVAVVQLHSHDLGKDQVVASGTLSWICMVWYQGCHRIGQVFGIVAYRHNREPQVEEEIVEET